MADNDTLTGGSGADRLLGGDMDDLLVGNGGGDWLRGGAGNDTIEAGADDLGEAPADSVFGGAGHDLITLLAPDQEGSNVGHLAYAGANNDTVSGSFAADTIGGGSGNDQITAESGDDLIFGGAGEDSIDAGSGEDTVYGGTGADTITGGEGADIFYFGGDHGADTITDFNADTDILVLANTETDLRSIDDIIANFIPTLVPVDGLFFSTGADSSLFIQGVTIEDLERATLQFDG